MMNETINHGVACDVKNCKYNSEGVNCTLTRYRLAAATNSAPAARALLKSTID